MCLETTSRINEVGVLNSCRVVLTYATNALRNDIVIDIPAHLIFGLEAHFFRCGRKARSCIFFLTKRFKNVRIIVSLGGD